eukprot:6194769-Pleurochrysis_carterae.AAC.1
MSRNGARLPVARSGGVRFHYAFAKPRCADLTDARLRPTPQWAFAHRARHAKIVARARPTQLVCTSVLK